MEQERPVKYAQVTEGVYRCGRPEPGSFNFLTELGLKTALAVSAEPPSKQLRLFFQDNGVELIHIWHETQESSWKPVSDELVKDTLELILDQQRHPILVFDVSGIDEVAIVVAILRRIQGWTFSAALAEYISFAKSKARLSYEHYFELFDIDIVT